MAEQATAVPQTPRTEWEIGKAMGALFGAPATDEQETATPEATQDVLGKTEGDEDEVRDPSDEEQNEDSAAEATSSEPFLTLNVSGQAITVGSKDEAIALAQQGVHYSQKMEAARQQEAKRADEHAQALAGVRAKESQYDTALQTLRSVYGHVLGDNRPDWASAEMQKLRAEKPEDYLAMREQWDQLDAIRGEVGRINRERQEQEEKRFGDWVRGEQEALAAKVPEWADAARRTQDYAAIRDYAVSYGVKEEELGNLFDHRYWLILRDAARYKQAEATGKTKREATATKAAEPGSGKNVNQGDRNIRAARERLRETGDERAAASLFNHMMTKPKGR